MILQLFRSKNYFTYNNSLWNVICSYTQKDYVPKIHQYIILDSKPDTTCITISRDNLLAPIGAL